MKFGPIDTAKAEGAVLAHSIALPSGRLRKGLRLEPAHLAELRAEGIDSIIVAQLASGDVDENTAAAQVAQAVLAAHPHLTMTRAFTGRVNLLADGPGVAQLDVGALEALNAVHPMITLATVPPFQQMAAGAWWRRSRLSLTPSRKAILLPPVMPDAARSGWCHRKSRTRR